MQQINTKKIKIIFVIIILIILSIIFLFMLKKNKKNKYNYNQIIISKPAPYKLINKNLVTSKNNKFTNELNEDCILNNIDNKNIKDNKNNLENINYKINNTIDKQNNNEKNNKIFSETVKNKKESEKFTKKINNTLNAKNISTKNNKQNNINDNNYQSILYSLNKSNYKEQNSQKEKIDFLNTYNLNNETEFINELYIAAGTIIPITLITGINSDLPGEIIGQVSTNIYDTISHKNLLIPKGSKVIAKYDSNISWGQERILIAWTTLIRPDGLVLNLPGFLGVDNMGLNGYTGNVNNHYKDIFKTTALSSLIEFGTSQISTLTNDELINKLFNSVNITSDNIIEDINSKIINRQPTIKINPGITVKMFVNKSLLLSIYNINSL